jgi:hypothetical protein
LPVVPPEVGVSPLLLALLHTAAFLDLSDDDVVNGPAACAVLDRIGLYLQDLEDDSLEQLADDLESLRKYAESQSWPSEAQEFLATFLQHCGFTLDTDEEAEEEEGEAASDDESSR